MKMIEERWRPQVNVPGTHTETAADSLGETMNQQTDTTSNQDPAPDVKEAVTPSAVPAAAETSIDDVPQEPAENPGETMNQAAASEPTNQDSANTDTEGGNDVPETGQAPPV